MDVTTFKAIVNYIGENKIATILFDNSSRKHFINKPFTIAEYLIETIGCLKIPEIDVKGNPYYVLKPVDTIQGFVYVDDANTKQYLDSRYIGC